MFSKTVVVAVRRRLNGNVITTNTNDHSMRRRLHRLLLGLRVNSVQRNSPHRDNCNATKRSICPTIWNSYIHVDFAINVLVNWSICRRTCVLFTLETGHSFVKSVARASLQRVHWKSTKLYTVTNVHSNVRIVQRNSKIWHDWEWVSENGDWFHNETVEINGKIFFPDTRRYP